jgi:glutathione S-transferase
VKLYVCWGTFPTPLLPGGHPCRKAYVALTHAGHEPEVERAFGSATLPYIPFNLTPGRVKVHRLTGHHQVPVLVTDDGQVIQGSEEIADWAQKHPA